MSLRNIKMAPYLGINICEAEALVLFQFADDLANENNTIS